MADQSLPIKPHFFQPLLPDFRTHLNIPVAFFKRHVEGRNDQNKTAKLRSDASVKTWLVKMDGLKFTDGWEDFAFAHNLRTGDIVVFRHEGEMVFHVTALGPSCCEIQYTSTHNMKDDRNDLTNITSGNSSRKKIVKKKPRKKVESSSDQSSFVTNVTVSSLSNDRLYLPLSFARSNGLDKMSGKRIVLLNEEGRSWKFNLKYNSKYTYARPGWRSFCAANGMCRGQKYTFKLVEKSGTPVMRLCLPERPKSESSLQHSSFVGSVTASSLKNDQLCLCKNFVSSNGLDKGCKKIVLKNEWGREWTLVLRQYKLKTILTHGWISFCQVNGLKTGDSFKFKLVRTRGEQLVLYLCPAESNHDKTPLECPEDSDNVKSLSSNPSCGDDSSKSEESEEENTKDKNISHGFLETKKRKYCSSSRASSSYSQTRFVTLTLTPSAFRTYRLYLPRYFTEMNGINKPGKITLLSQDGVKRVVDLFQQNGGIMRFGKGWREFCKAHGVKIDESFVLELIWEDEASPVLKFRTKVNST